MPKHNVYVNLPWREIGKVDVIFNIYRDGEKLGQIDISKGDIQYYAFVDKFICNLWGYVVYLHMIKSIVHKGLRRLWEKDDPSKLPAEQVNKIRRILETLDTIKTLEPLRLVSGYRLHQLTGNLKGHWSITVTGNYRITFRFEEEDVYVVDYQDYH